MLRPVDAVDGEPAAFTRRLDGEISHPEDALPERLMHRDVLDFRELDGARHLGEEAGFVAHFVSGDGHLGDLAAEVPLDGPDQQDRDGCGQPCRGRGRAVDGKPSCGRNQEQYQDVTEFDEL